MLRCEVPGSLAFHSRPEIAKLFLAPRAFAMFRMPLTHGLLLICLALLGPRESFAERSQERRPAPAADQAKDGQTLCPVRWGKRPRREGGPGAELYVSAWGPCNAEPQVVKTRVVTTTPVPLVVR